MTVKADSSCVSRVLFLSCAFLPVRVKLVVIGPAKDGTVSVASVKLPGWGEIVKAWKPGSVALRPDVVSLMMSAIHPTHESGHNCTDWRSCPWM